MSCMVLISHLDEHSLTAVFCFYMIVRLEHGACRAHVLVLFTRPAVRAERRAVELRQLVQHLLGQAGHDRRPVLVLVRVLAEVEEAAARAAVMDPVEGEFRAVRRLVLPS